MTTAYGTKVLATSGLVSYWELDETSGTTAADSFGSNPGTYTGGFTLNQTGVSGKAALFDGSSGYVTVPTSAGLSPTAAITVECWCKQTGAASSNNYNKIVAKGFSSNGSPYEDYGILVNMQGGHFGGTMFGNNYEGTTAPADGVWYHLVLTWGGSGQTPKFFVNSRQESTGAGTGTAITASGQPLMIGAHNRGGNIGEYFGGTVDAVAIYNTALTQATISDHFNTGWFGAGTGGRASADGADASFNFGNVTVLDGQSSAFIHCWVNVASWTAANAALFNRNDGFDGWQVGNNSVADPGQFRVLSSGSSYYSAGSPFAGAGWVPVGAYLNTSGGVIRTYRNGAVVTATTGNQLTVPTSNLIVNLTYPAQAVAEPALFRSLTSGQADTIAANLAAGAAPMLQTPAPVFYSHFGNTGTETDLAGGATATVPGNSQAVAGPVVAGTTPSFVYQMMEG